jgi:hypothetical protein
MGIHPYEPNTINSDEIFAPLTFTFPLNSIFRHQQKSSGENPNPFFASHHHHHSGAKCALYRNTRRTSAMKNFPQ